MVFKRHWYLVKKIEPATCPSCQMSFRELEQGGFAYRWQEEISRPKEKEICCNNCFDWLKIKILEERVVRKKEEAERLMKEEGFTGFILIPPLQGLRRRFFKKG